MGNVTMFWKKSQDDPDEAWKEQHEALLTNPLYSLIDIQQKGKLIDIYRSTFETEGTLALERYIRTQLEPYFYNKGHGQIINEIEYKGWKIDKMKKKNPSLEITPSSINCFDDPFNKFQDHEACWDLNKRGGTGETALHLCLLGNSELHLAIAKVLLRLYPKLSLDVYESTEYYGESGLHIAIVNNDIDMVKLLVESGADINQRATGRFFLPEDQKNGQTKMTNYIGYAYYGEYPLAFAASFGREEIYDYLLDHGAHPDMQDSFGNTALHMMVICNQLTMSAYAVKHHNKKASMEVLNNAKLSPLTLASKLGRNDIFKEFIELQSIEIWRYSNITCSTYPLGPLDTIGPGGKTNWSAALLYLTEGETEDHLDMLAGGVIKQLLYSKWKTYGRRRFIERLVLAVLHLLCLSIAIYTRPNDNVLLGNWDAQNMVRYTAEVVVCIACFSNLMFQLEEIRTQGVIGFIKNQAGAPAKIMFNISCFLILLCIPMRFLKYVGAEIVLLSMAAPLAWTFLLFFARGLHLTGPFVVMIYKMMATDIVRFVVIFCIFLVQFSQGFELSGVFVTMFYQMLKGDLCRFGIIYLIVIFFGFTPCFYFLFKDIENENIQTFKSIDGTVMQLFQMTLGEFKYEDFDHTRIPILTKAVFAVFAILVPILLLNMLIAMMGNTYNMIISRSEKEWKRQWAKIIIVLERTFSPKQLKMYQDTYSSGLPNGEGCGLIVIKTSLKTKARQRKGAIANWKKLVNEIKLLIKEQRKEGKKGPIDLTSEEVSEKLTERQMKKRRSNMPDSDGPELIGSQSAGGLLSAMSQLAWEKDIDLGKGNLQEPAIKEHIDEDGSVTRTSSPGDRTPLLKDPVKTGMGVVKTGSHATAPPTGGAQTNTANKSAKPKSLPANKVHPTATTKSRPPSRADSKTGPASTVTVSEKNAKTDKKNSKLLKGNPSRPPSARSNSGASKESKDSAFVSESSRATDSRSGRRTNLAITGSRSSLNSASSLTSLLQAWDGAKDNNSKKQDSTEF